MGRFHRHADGTVEEHDHRDVGDHSGYRDTGPERVAVLENILGENDRTADRNRADFARAGITTVNLMSSPGSGKTTLLKRTITSLGERVRLGILEGDIATSLDADELGGLGAPVSLVNTSAGFGGECHLDATMVRSGLGRLPLEELDVLIIENVGNLVCPAEFDVGQQARAMVYAITEGEEKPLKYPVMFRACDVVVVNKVDLLPHLDFDLNRFLANLACVNPTARVIQLSARTGEGMAEWCDWILDTQARSAGMAPASSSEQPPHDHGLDMAASSQPEQPHPHHHDRWDQRPVPVTLAHLTFDCADAQALASFWAAVLDGPVDQGASEFFASIDATEASRLSWFFIKVPEAKSVKNRLHVDVTADDRELEMTRLLGLGATRISDHDEWGAIWTVMSDPEGNEFCVGQRPVES